MRIAFAWASLMLMLMLTLASVLASAVSGNDGAQFVDVTEKAGITFEHRHGGGGDKHIMETVGGGASLWDYDGDGDLDIYFLNGAPLPGYLGPQSLSNALYRNDGGRFVDVTEEAGLTEPGYSMGCVVADYDNDGDIDLYVSNIGPNRLFQNQGDATFIDVTAAAGVGQPSKRSFATRFFDYDNDGWLDLLAAPYDTFRGFSLDLVVADYLGRKIPGAEYPRLYRNQGDGTFKNVTRQLGLETVLLAMGANFGDLDNDGWLDFYLGTGYPFYEALMPNRMFRNRQGHGFADVTTAGGFGHLQKGHAIVFADLENDGDQEGLQQMGGSFPGDAFGNALFANPGFGNHWVKLSLVGVHTNRFGLGARIRVDIVEQGKRRSIYRRVSSGATFGGNPFRREIGLGTAGSIEAIEIYWPASDTTQRFEGLKVDQWIEVTEGESDYRVLPLNALTLGQR